MSAFRSAERGLKFDGSNDIAAGRSNTLDADAARDLLLYNYPLCSASASTNVLG